MPEQKAQPLEGQLNENDLAALLGYMTTLNQHANGQHPDQIAQQEAAQAQNQPESAPPAPEVAPTPDPRVDELESQFKALREEVSKTMKDEMGQVKEMVQKALEEDDKNEPA